MTTVESIEHILTEALAKEIEAEKNCVLLLETLVKNGFHDQVEKIKNDEIHHQQMIKELLTILKG